MGELPLANIDLSLLAHSGGETTTNTLNRGQGVDDLLLAINVGVEDTQNVLELSLVHKTLFPWLERYVEGTDTILSPTMLSQESIWEKRAGTHTEIDNKQQTDSI